MRLMSPLCFAGTLLRKKYFGSYFLISCRCVAVVPPKVATIKSYYHRDFSNSKVLRKTIFPKVDEVPIPSTAMSKLIRSCSISSGGGLLEGTHF